MPDGRTGTAKATRGNAKARELVEHGIALMEHDGYKEAAASFDKAISLLEGEKAGPEELIRAYVAVSRLNLLTRDLDRCEAFALKAVDQMKKQGVGPAAKGEAMNAYGAALAWKGERAPALANLERSLSYFEAAKDEWGVARACRNIGTVHLFRSLFAKSLAYYNRASKVFEELRRDEEVWSILVNIALAKGLQGLYSDAIKDYERIVVHCNKEGRGRLVATSHTNMGFFYHRMGDLDKAMAHYEESSRLYGTMEVRGPDFFNIIGKADVLLARGDVEAADKLIRANLEALMASGSDDIIGRVQRTSGLLSMERGDLKRAEEHFAKAEKRLDAALNEVVRAQVYIDWARAKLKAGDGEGATQMFDKAREIFSRLRLPLLEKELDTVLRKGAG